METEITSQTIDSYVKGLVNINNCIGRLDMLKLYSGEVYGQDVILMSSLDNIYKQLISISGCGDKTIETPQIMQQPITQIELKKEPIAYQFEQEYKNNFDFTLPIIFFNFDSENLDTLKYSPYTQKVYIKFKKNKEVYEYSSISQTEILNLCNAKSAGTYFHKVFKNKYSCEKITESVG